MPNHDTGPEPQGRPPEDAPAAPLPQPLPAPPPASPIAPYGPPPAPYYGGYPGVMARPATNGPANTGGILGIIAFVVGWIPLLGIFFGWPLGVIAIVFSGIGLSRAGKLGGAGKGMAVAGLVLGILTVVFKSIPGFNIL